MFVCSYVAYYLTTIMLNFMEWPDGLAHRLLMWEVGNLNPGGVKAMTYTI